MKNLKSTSFIIIAFLVSQIFAQTYTDCNPLIAKCNPDPALGTIFSWDFSDQGNSERFEAIGSKDQITYDDRGVNFAISKSGDAPTISSKFYIMFGNVEITARAAKGIGIVSAAVLISDNLDEIDWEWLGKEDAQVQTNYFSKGDDSTYNRGGYSNASNNQDEYHTYGIEWTASRIIWSIDGRVTRVLENPGTGYYPQTPMQVRIGSWSGGDFQNRPGTIEWAGGETDYMKGPFYFSVKSISIQDYSKGKEYVYGDHSGSWTSIQAIDGEINQDYVEIESSLMLQSISFSDHFKESTTQINSFKAYTTGYQVAPVSFTVAAISSVPAFDEALVQVNENHEGSPDKSLEYMVKKSYLEGLNTTIVQTNGSSGFGSRCPNLLIIFIFFFIIVI